MTTTRSRSTVANGMSVGVEWAMLTTSGAWTYVIEGRWLGDVA